MKKSISEVLSAKEIKEIIKAKGWSQKEIAEYWGVTENWIYLLIKNSGAQRSVRDDCAFRGLPDKRGEVGIYHLT